ncbi:hypothetical protein [Agromyces sp. Leaf222]|uniref:hypothetical protein n=1 Tax=Agromyces sp. Leaf222 TaxID=1735688 RepID=UPI0012FA6194|nr:hypothetical protein [Agromyces sp. Leaf222]
MSHEDLRGSDGECGNPHPAAEVFAYLRCSQPAGELQLADREALIGIYAALDILVWVLIVPIAGLSLISGIAQAIGTPWGLLRYYWIGAKLLLTVGATVILLLHTGAVGAAAEAARDGGRHFDALRTQLVVDSAAALVVLALATVLSVVKPRGMTPWANRAIRRENQATAR